MVLKRVVLISALTSAGCLIPSMGSLAQQGTTDQGTTGNQDVTGRPIAAPPGTARNQGSSAGQQGQAGAAAGSSDVSGQHGTGGPLSRQDREFVQQAAQGGLAEVELGQLAQQNASSDAVKQFGKRMVDDHSQANDKLMQIAENHGLTPPTSVDEKHKALMSRLSAMNGKDFDRAYMAAMVDDHKKDIREFEQAAGSSSAQDVKQFAQQTLPTLKQHLELANSVHSKVAHE
ncbi:MAG: DUF4142 domain-containing protein [Candidatus Competibacteraceae bacterium]